MIVWEKHGTEMKDILIMHFIAKPHTNRRGVLTGVVTTASKATAFYFAVFKFVRPRIIYERDRFTGEQTTIDITTGCIQLHRVVRIIRTSRSGLDSTYAKRINQMWKACEVDNNLRDA